MIKDLEYRKRLFNYYNDGCAHDEVDCKFCSVRQDCRLMKQIVKDVRQEMTELRKLDVQISEDHFNDANIIRFFELEHTGSKQLSFLIDAYLKTKPVVREELSKHEILMRILNDEKVLDHLDNLNCRWKDEKEYENWKDYEDSMRKMTLPEDCEFVKSTKRPFGFQCKIKGVLYIVGLKVRKTTISLIGKKK